MKALKKCKGINKAKDFTGCGELVPTQTRKYGLCLPCLREWAYSTGEGQEYIRKQIIPQAKREVKRKQKEQDQKTREKLETKSDLEKKLQKEINKIVRLIDKGHPCISSGRNLGKNYDAGHLYSVGSNPQIRFHLFNIFAQSVHDNQWKSGNQLDYSERLEDVFGTELKSYCLSLKGMDSLHLSKEELREKTNIARGIVKWLKLQDRTFTTEERITLRHRFQKEIGIYEPIKV